MCSVDSDDLKPSDILGERKSFIDSGEGDIVLDLLYSSFRFWWGWLLLG